jgi:inorganic triphosphatase YgiF
MPEGKQSMPSIHPLEDVVSALSDVSAQVIAAADAALRVSQTHREALSLDLAQLHEQHRMAEDVRTSLLRLDIGKAVPRVTLSSLAPLSDWLETSGARPTAAQLLRRIDGYLCELDRVTGLRLEALERTQEVQDGLLDVRLNCSRIRAALPGSLRDEHPRHSPRYRGSRS